MKRKLLALLSAVVLCVGTIFLAVGCGKEKDYDLVIAQLSAGRGETYVTKLVEGFEKTPYVQSYLKEKKKDKLEVKLIQGKAATIGESVRNSINSGVTPDVLFLNFNMSGVEVTESFVRAKQLVDLTSLLEEKVYNEETTLGDKLVPGLLENYTTKPYGDGKVYSLPAYYSPTGLWYDASRFFDDGKGDEYTWQGSGDNAGKYELPHTWSEFWALGDELNKLNNNNANTSATNPSLFTYPTAGYFDGFIYSAVAGMAGEEDFLKMLGYADGIWSDDGVQDALEIVVKLRNYINQSTVTNATKEGYLLNQKAVIGEINADKQQTAKGTALFMPNGDWLPGEMANDTPEGFEWGFMPLPAKDNSSMSYVNTFLENVYLHKDGKHLDMGKQFLLYYFSNEGASIVAKDNKAIIPTKDALTKAKANGVPDSTIELYKVYDGNGAVSGSFAATEQVTGLVWNDVLYNDLNGKVFNKTVTGSKKDAELLAEWTTRLKEASDKMRAAIIK